jgi:hypothetical protein
MSISFVLFQEHPDTMKAITEQVDTAVKTVTDGLNPSSNPVNWLMLLCCAGLLDPYGKILAAVDAKIGELGLAKVAEFITDILEVFCRFFNIDLADMANVTKVSESIQNIIRSVSAAMQPIFGNRKRIFFYTYNNFTSY